jgi:hypothetical protein
VATLAGMPAAHLDNGIDISTAGFSGSRSTRVLDCEKASWAMIGFFKPLPAATIWIRQLAEYMPFSNKE